MIDLKKFDGHTPGPWKRGGLERIYDSQIREICDVRGWGWLQHLPNGAQQQDANIALIAAAPDLLAEVIRLRAMLEKAREGLSCGLWDYGPGQSEHDQCDQLLSEIDAVLGVESLRQGGAA